MPTVKQYSPSSDKSGYYVTAYIGGEHPINIKSRPLADRLFEKLGFGERENITHNLCWAMYEADLLYTDNSLSDYDDDGTIRGDLSNNLSSLSLTPEQRTHLASLLNQYSDTKKFADLKDILEEDNALPVADQSTTTDGGDAGSGENAIRAMFDEVQSDTENDGDDESKFLDIDAEAVKNTLNSTESIDDYVLTVIDMWGATLSTFSEEQGGTSYTRDEYTSLSNSVKGLLNESVPTVAKFDTERFDTEPGRIHVADAVTYKYPLHHRTGFQTFTLTISDCRPVMEGARGDADFLVSAKFTPNTTGTTSETEVIFELTDGRLQQLSANPRLYSVSINPKPFDMASREEAQAQRDALEDVREIVQSVLASGDLPQVSYDPSSV